MVKILKSVRQFFKTSSPSSDLFPHRPRRGGDYRGVSFFSYFYLLQVCNCVSPPPLNPPQGGEVSSPSPPRRGLQGGLTREKGGQLLDEDVKVAVPFVKVTYNRPPSRMGGLKRTKAPFRGSCQPKIQNFHLIQGGSSGNFLELIV